jgi:hypothetical protein
LGRIFGIVRERFEAKRARMVLKIRMHFMARKIQRALREFLLRHARGEKR